MSILRGYLLRRLAIGYAVMLVIIGSLVWLVELLERLGDLGEQQLGLAGLAWSAARTVPLSLIDLLPVVTILATATVLAALQHQRELTVFRASGVSLLRITRIALVPGLGLALGALVALQWLAPVMYQEPDRFSGVGLGETSLWHAWHGLWVRSDRVFLNVGDLELGRVPADINIYEFDDQGKMTLQIHAARAIFEGRGQWLLEDVQIKSLDGAIEPRVQRVDTYHWDSILTARQLDLLRQPAASLPLTDLWRYVEGLQVRQQDASEFELVFWRRMALPLACIGMVLVATALAATPMKSRATGLRVTLAVVVGLGYELLTGLIGFFGLVAHLPAAPVALVPPLLLAALALWMLLRSR